MRGIGHLRRSTRQHPNLNAKAIISHRCSIPFHIPFLFPFPLSSLALGQTISPGPSPRHVARYDAATRITVIAQYAY